MRKIGEAVRLRAGGLTLREIAVSLGVGRSTASEYLKRAERAGLGWPLPDGVSEADLERRLFKPVGGDTRRGPAQPDWPAVHRALKRKGVTLALVWEEYRAAHPEDGYGYSPRCARIASRCLRTLPALGAAPFAHVAPEVRHHRSRAFGATRQHHVAGERAFVDYAGDTLEGVDGATGELRQAPSPLSSERELRVSAGCRRCLSRSYH